jgi:hypothetical protein
MKIVTPSLLDVVCEVNAKTRRVVPRQVQRQADFYDICACGPRSPSKLAAAAGARGVFAIAPCGTACLQHEGFQLGRLAAHDGTKLDRRRLDRLRGQIDTVRADGHQRHQILSGSNREGRGADFTTTRETAGLQPRTRSATVVGIGNEIQSHVRYRRFGARAIRDGTPISREDGPRNLDGTTLDFHAPNAPGHGGGEPEVKAKDQGGAVAVLAATLHAVAS